MSYRAGGLDEMRVIDARTGRSVAMPGLSGKESCLVVSFDREHDFISILIGQGTQQRTLVLDLADRRSIPHSGIATVVGTSATGKAQMLVTNENTQIDGEAIPRATPKPDGYRSPRRILGGVMYCWSNDAQGNSTMTVIDRAGRQLAPVIPGLLSEVTTKGLLVLVGTPDAQTSDVYRVDRRTGSVCGTMCLVADGRLSEAVHEFRDFRRRHWRLRLLAVIGLLTLVAGLMFFHNERLNTAASGATEDPTSVLLPVGTFLQPHCPPVKLDGRPTLETLNQVVGNLDYPYLQAADVAASGMLSDRRIIWVFGDTIRRASVVPNMVSNAIAITSDRCVSQMLVRRAGTTQPGPVIADRSADVVHWPTSVTVLPASGGDDVVVFTSRIRRTGFGAFDFVYLGADAYRLFVPRGGVPQLRNHLELTPDAAGPVVNWGGASVAHDGYLYVFGTKDSIGGSRQMFVGRAPLPQLTDRAKWSFWDGGAWTPDYRAAANVLAPGDGVSQTFSADVIDGRFVVVSKCGGDFGDTVCMWSSIGPTGPWQRSQQVRVPFRDGAAFQYAPLAHPELRLADGKLPVSYSRNTDNLGTLIRDPKLGRPVFVAIDWPRP